MFNSINHWQIFDISDLEENLNGSVVYPTSVLKNVNKNQFV